METCKNCNAELSGKYCSQCGQKSHFERINLNYIIHEIQHIIHFEKGFLYTAKLMLLRPSSSIRGFIEGNRTRMTKPIIFLILCGIIFALTNHTFHFKEVIQTPQTKEVYPIIKWAMEHYAYFHLLNGLISVFWINIFWARNQYNFFEITTLMCYIMGFSILIDTILAFFEKHLDTNQLSFFVGLLYLSWAIGRFFGNKRINYIKALMVCLLSFVTMIIIILLLGILLKEFV